MPTEHFHIYARSDPDSETGMRFILLPSGYTFLSNDEDIEVGAVDLEYQVPSHLNADELRKLAIQTLEKKQREVMAEAERRRNELQGKINDLLRLEHQQDATYVLLRDDEDDIPF